MEFTISRYIKPGYVTTVSETLNYEGLWRIDGGEAPVPGSLSITPEGIWLKLNGAFENEHRSSAQELANHDLILGIQHKGGQFTLEKCEEVRNQSGSAYTVQTFAVKTVYIGIHAETLNELKFNNYRIQYTYLSDWFRNIGFYEPKETDGDFFVEYKGKNGTTKLKAYLKDASVEMISQPGWNWQKSGREVALQISDAIKVQCQSPMSFKDVSVKLLEPLQKFISLATARPNSVTNLSVKLEDSKGERSITIHTQNPYPSQKYFSLFNRGIILFSAKDIADNPKHYLERWLALEEEMRDVCELFLDVHYDPGAFITNRFLNIVQALEAYNRARYGNKISKKTEKGSKKRDKFFKERIEELIDKVYSLIEDLIPDSEEFISWVNDTRNYLTHRDRGTKNHIASGDSLDLLTLSLLWLLRIHFLIEVGFNHEQCVALLERNEAYKEICRLVKLRSPWFNSPDKS